MIYLNSLFHDGNIVSALIKKKIGLGGRIHAVETKLAMLN